MKRYFVILFLLYCIQGKAQYTNLVWSDEFNDASINKANWTYDLGGGGWGNSELEYYTNRAVNSNVADGNLRIIAKKESYGGSSYTSARMKTQGLQNFTYGKIEARVKIPVGQGLWPAFWMLGKNITTVGWPKCGEIDILEHISNKKEVNGTIHWDNNGHVSAGKATPWANTSDYHVYGIEWEEKAIKWFLDGNKYYEVNIANNISSTDELHMPQFIILNLAVGGAWPGNPDATTQFPDTMFVDYVRVYQLSTGIGTIENNPKTDQFSLDQNYPNPFKLSTTFSFHLPSKSFVTLKVLDAVGREVASIESNELLAGNYTREWNASEFPGGIYFYRLEAGEFSETRKLIINK